MSEQKEFRSATLSDAQPGHPASGGRANWATRFLWSLSGGAIRYLRLTYPDHNRYKNIGFAVLATGIFAGISSAFAASYIFPDSFWAPIVVGLLWGFTIFNLDMLIVGTSVKPEKFRLNQFFTLLLRCVLALAIAFTISVPLEIRLFKDIIDKQITEQNALDLKSFDQRLAALPIQVELDTLKSQRERKYQDLKHEMWGIQGKSSGIEGYGPRSKRIDEELTKQDSAIAILQRQRDSVVLDFQAQYRDDLDQTKSGFFSAYRALETLKQGEENTPIRHASWGIRILFIIIELLPILSKYLLPRGPYDALYERESSLAIRQYEQERHEETRTNDLLIRRREEDRREPAPTEERERVVY